VNLCGVGVLFSTLFRFPEFRKGSHGWGECLDDDEDWDWGLWTDKSRVEWTLSVKDRYDMSYFLDWVGNDLCVGNSFFVRQFTSCLQFIC
jgi:hypothetical protein